MSWIASYRPALPTRRSNSWLIMQIGIATEVQGLHYLEGIVLSPQRCVSLCRPGKPAETQKPRSSPAGAFLRLPRIRHLGAIVCCPAYDRLTPRSAQALFPARPALLRAQ